MCAEPRWSKSPSKTCLGLVDGAELALAIGLLVVGHNFPTHGLCVVAVADVFLALLILSAAVKASPPDHRLYGVITWQEPFPLPTRLAALLILPLTMYAIVLGFADAYLTDGGILDGRRTPLPNIETARYFSAVTFTTLGYGDFAPSTAQSRALVEWELFSGFLSLVAAIPLLVGRLSSFHNER